MEQNEVSAVQAAEAAATRTEALPSIDPIRPSEAPSTVHPSSGSGLPSTVFCPEEWSWILVPSDNFPLSPTTSGVALVNATGERLDTSTVAAVEPPSMEAGSSGSHVEDSMGRESSHPFGFVGTATSSMSGSTEGIAVQLSTAEAERSINVPHAESNTAIATHPVHPASPPRVPSPLPESVPSSPCVLRESIDSPEGEAVAALAISELLDPQCTLSQQPLTLPLPECCDASFGPLHAELHQQERRQHQRQQHLLFGYSGLGVRSFESRKLGALAFADNQACYDHTSHRGAEAEEDEEDTLDDDNALDALAAWGRSYGRPFAIALALLASHAVVLYVGIHLGKAAANTAPLSHSSGTPANGGGLARRFSSGSAGQHARLCMA